MARTKAVLGSGARLSDYLSASLLARVVCADVVHAVLNEHGRNSQRIRSFPAVAGVYYCMALKMCIRDSCTAEPGCGNVRTGTGGPDGPCTPRTNRSAGRTRPSAPHCCGTAFIGTV